MGNARPNDTLRLADYDRISLLIDLYFPRLFSTFRQYTSAIDSFLIAEGNVRRDAKGFGEDLSNIGNIGLKLKAEVVALSRKSKRASIT